MIYFMYRVLLYWLIYELCRCLYSLTYWLKVFIYSSHMSLPCREWRNNKELPCDKWRTISWWLLYHWWRDWCLSLVIVSCYVIDGEVGDWQIPFEITYWKEILKEIFLQKHKVILSQTYIDLIYKKLKEHIARKKGGVVVEQHEDVLNLKLIFT